MSSVATSSPDHNNYRETAPVFISSAEMLNSKMNALLRVMGQCMPMLLDETSEFESKELRAKYEGGCSDAAQVTYIKSCARLDRIIDNDKNWQIGKMDRLMRERTAELHEMDLKIAAKRLERENYYNRPSVRANANLFKRERTFYAVVGNTFTTESVYGEGSTPEAAYANLDAILDALPAAQKSTKAK